jgi:hypothetical protein
VRKTAQQTLSRRGAAGADLGSVQIIKSVKDGEDRRTFNLQRDLLLLEKECERIGDVSLVIMDPVSSYLGKTDSHKNAEVRGVLEPIGEFADRLNIAVLSITHFSKSGAGSATKALHRFIGSIAFVGAPRIALAVIEEDGRYLLLHANPPISRQQVAVYLNRLCKTGEATKEARGKFRRNTMKWASRDE